MKNQIRYIAVLVLTVFSAMSCEDSSKNPLPGYSRSAIPVFTPNEDDSGIINLLDLSETNLSFAVATDGRVEVEHVDVYLTYTNNVTKDVDSIMFETISTFPANFTLTLDQLLDLFDPEVVTQDSLSIGDAFTFGGYVLLADGRYLTGGYSPSVVANEPVTLNYNVACPSDIPVGSYTATQADEDEWFGSATTKQVTITKVNGTANQYLISDVSAGGYAFCCLAFNYKADQPAIISDICNTIIVTGPSSSQIVTGPGDMQGSWDPETQTLTVYYQDTLNGSDDLKSVFVKN
ncbi:MAG TPA: hypothetical protein VD816_05420 [Ohtaekwangia sp.]|nr:hypothetical protein [Ohtaekwangia sp.]